MKLKNVQPTILMKFGIPLAINVYYTVQVNLECCKSCVSDMGPNTILKIKKYISKDILKMKLKEFPTYNPYEIGYSTCYHIPLHDTIQFGLLQSLWARHFEDYFLLSKGV